MPRGHQMIPPDGDGRFHALEITQPIGTDRISASTNERLRAMTKNEMVAGLVKWPTNDMDVSINGMLRIVGYEAQRVWLEKMDSLGGPSSDPALHVLRIQMVLSSVGFMACLRALREVDEAKAAAFAREYWAMCDAGDSIGEFLWQFIEEAGLDPELIEQPERELRGDPVRPSGQGDV